ncbi:hypothetical protein GXY_11659 [Novacetimonas hansenii ATCC 23769]|uniref:Uncharacterized protein n=1 Tax=Novacetimonas hansenii ATCC 23769 TaxID=714995 RepID=D5QGR0_NOVHA|nr:hypothetical protein GXY_11659 [Novacetimonas hansenii ATCC 23769]
MHRILGKRRMQDEVAYPQQQGSEIERGRGGVRMNDVRQSWTLIQQGHALTAHSIFMEWRQYF